MAPITKLVTVEVVDKRVAVVKYNSPKTGNSFHDKMAKDIFSALSWVMEKPDISVIIVTGEGRFYSTGMHLDDSVDVSTMSLGPGSTFHKLNRLLINCNQVLIAAVNGPAAGYGVSQLALFDLVYSVPDAYFFTPFVKWGMAAEGSSSITFPRIMGHQKAAAMFLAAERVTAQDLDKLGLITKILPKDEFQESVIKIAKQVAQSPPGSLRATKELMRKPVREALLEANDRECGVLQYERIPSGEPKQAISQFRKEQEEKRKAKSKI